MPRIRIALIVAATAALLPAVAIAAYHTGPYRGRTAQRLAISFAAGPHAVTGLTYAVHYTCSTGRSYTGTPLRDSTAYAIRAGRFGGRTRSASGATVSEVHGRLSSRSASGTVRRTVRIDTVNQRPDPAGDETCDSGRVHFTAVLHPAARRTS